MQQLHAARGELGADELRVKITDVGCGKAAGFAAIGPGGLMQGDQRFEAGERCVQALRLFEHQCAELFVLFDASSDLRASVGAQKSEIIAVACAHPGQIDLVGRRASRMLCIPGPNMPRPMRRRFNARQMQFVPAPTQAWQLLDDRTPHQLSLAAPGQEIVVLNGETVERCVASRVQEQAACRDRPHVPADVATEHTQADQLTRAPHAQYPKRLGAGQTGEPGAHPGPRNEK